MNIKKISGLSATLVLALSMSTLYAEESDLTQTRIQDQTRTKLNLQIPDSVAGQTVYGNKAQNQVQNRNQYQHQYQNGLETGTGKTGESDRSIERSSNRSTQSSTNAGSMNRQSSGNQSSGGGGGGGRR